MQRICRTRWKKTVIGGTLEIKNSAQIKALPVCENQIESIALTIENLKSDFNNLLANLTPAGIMEQDEYEESLRNKVKANLIINHNKDDILLERYICAIICYAEIYQKKNKDIIWKILCYLQLSK